MMGPKGTELSDLELESASLVADTSAGKDGASVVERIDDVVRGGVVNEDCEVSLDVWEIALGDGIVDELVDSIADNDVVVVADVDGGFAYIVSLVATRPQPTCKNDWPKSLSEMTVEQ
jgi:hypothetical protein